MSSVIRSLMVKVGADLSEFKSGMAEAARAMQNGFGDMDLSQTNEAIKALTQSAKLTESEFKKAVAGMDDWRTNADGLRARITYLNDTLDDQRVILDGLQRKLELTKEKYGEDSREANNLQIAINNQTAKIRENDAELKKVTNQLDNFGKETQDASEKSSRLGDIFKGGLAANVVTQAVTAAWSAVKDFAKSALDLANNLMKQKDVTGRSVEELQKLKYIGDDLGVSVDTIDSAQKKLIKSMAAVQNGSKEQTEAFKTLKVSAVDPATGALRNSNEVMYEAFDALKNVSNETERDALAMQLFGKSATELNPLILAGSDALRKLGEDAEKSGAKMSEHTVEVLDAAGDAFDHFKQTAVAAIGEFVATAIESFDALTVDKVTKAAQAVDTVGKKYDETALRNAAAVTVAEGYVKTLKDLETQGLETTASQEQYRSTVAKLNAVMPGLNVKINEQTGLIEGGTKALYEHISALKKEAEAQAYQEKYKDILKAQADATWELADNQRKQQEAQDNLNNSSAQLDVAYQMLASQLGITNQEAVAMGNDLNKMYEMSRMAGGGTNDLATQILNLHGEIGKASSQYDIYSQAIEKGEQAVKASGLSASEAEKTYALLTGTTLNLANATNTAKVSEDAIIGSISATKTSADNLATAYKNAHDSALNSINGQMKLFGDLKESSEVSSVDIVESLKKQSAALDNYNTNLEKAKLAGIDLDLLAQVADGSAESAKLIEGMASATPEQVKKINQSYKDLATEKETYATNIAKIKTDFDASMDGIQEKLSETAKAADKYTEMSENGRHAVQGLIDGINSKMYELNLAVANMAGVVDKRTRVALGISSPSKVMMELGGYTGEGFAVGLRNKIGDIYDIGNQMADAVRAAAAIDNTRFSISAALDASGSALNDAATLGASDTIPTIQSTPGVSNASELSEVLSNALKFIPQGDLIIPLNVNGVEFHRATIKDFRQVNGENPEPRSDF